MSNTEANFIMVILVMLGVMIIILALQSREHEARLDNLEEVVGITEGR